MNLLKRLEKVEKRLKKDEKEKCPQELEELIKRGTYLSELTERQLELLKEYDSTQHLIGGMILEGGHDVLLEYKQELFVPKDEEDNRRHLEETERFIVETIEQLQKEKKGE